MCSECGKVLKTLEKLEAHCSGHGDPEKECDKCHKVFASKATLRNHKKLHQKKHKCTVCKKSFLTPASLETHVSKTHCYKCSSCDYSSTKYLELVQHQKEHNYDRYSDITVEFADWEVPSTEDLVVYEESESREEVYVESQSREEENEESQSREEEYEESQSREEDAAIAKLLSDKNYISDSETINKTDKVRVFGSFFFILGILEHMLHIFPNTFFFFNTLQGVTLKEKHFKSLGNLGLNLIVWGVWGF